MSDAWTEEPATPKKKSGLPAWFWWTCGTGCLLALLVAGGAVIFGVVVTKKVTDPEYVKGKLAEVLPCDTWPEEYKPGGGGLFGMGVYIIMWPNPSGQPAVVATLPGRSDLKTSLDPSSLQNKVTNKNLTAGQIEIQGRIADTLTFKDLAGLVHLRTDISGEKAPYATLELSAPEEHAAGLEEATVKFLEPFDVWRGED
jgi:hypothetical protein